MQFQKLLATGLFAIAGLAQASTTLYVDAGVYSAALTSAGLVSSQVSSDFDAAAAANGVSDSQSYGLVDPAAIVVGAVSFKGLDDGNAAGFLVQNTYGVTGAFYTHQLFSGTDNAFTITFASPITAVAFESNVLNFTIDGPTGSLPIVLTTSAGDVVNTFSTPLYWGGVDLGTAPQVFNGLISTKPFTSLTISSATQAFNVTGLVVVPAPVPEPATLALVLAGLATMTLTLRRSKAA